jgi:hypothetical protein
VLPNAILFLIISNFVARTQLFSQQIINEVFLALLNNKKLLFDIRVFHEMKVKENSP